MSLILKNGKKTLDHNFTDRPCIINDAMHWKNNGIPHRVNGPSKRERYFFKGKPHSFDCPSIIINTSEWCVNGLHHKIDQPALIHNDNDMYYYLYGRAYAYKGTTTRSYRDDGLHLDHGPAVIRADGTQKWYINGQLHREDGPAVIDKSGAQYWYINGRLHREDGPAVIYSNGTQHWYSYGRFIKEIKT